VKAHQAMEKGGLIRTVIAAASTSQHIANPHVGTP
jgi:hypothetical protein